MLCGGLLAVEFPDFRVYGTVEQNLWEGFGADFCERFCRAVWRKPPGTHCDFELQATCVGRVSRLVLTQSDQDGTGVPSCVVTLPFR